MPNANGDVSMRISRFLALAFLAAAPGVALAEGGPMQGACKTDLQALCGSIQQGGGRIRDCMRQHRTELSAACKVAIADRMLERSAQRGAATGAGVTVVTPAH
jgi:hypothetical protein